MFYDENSTISMCEEDPSLIFDLIDEGHEQMVDKVLTSNIVDINTTNENNMDVLSYLLKKGWYNLVLKHMKRKNWQVNNQDREGDTFAHVLVTKKYLDVMEIIKELQKNKNFIPNIRNNKGETILDKSISNNYLYTTFKILEDERFNDIDLVSFKNLYESYIKNNNYGTYSKMYNLEFFIDNLEDKELLPTMEKLLQLIKTNFDKIKEELINKKMKELDKLIYGLLEESAF